MLSSQDVKKSDGSPEVLPVKICKVTSSIKPQGTAIMDHMHKLAEKEKRRCFKIPFLKWCCNENKSSQCQSYLRDSEVNPGAGEKASENVRIYRSVGLVKRSYEAIIDQTHKWGKWQLSYIRHQKSYLLITIRQNHKIQTELAHKQGPGSIYFMIPQSIAVQCWNLMKTSWPQHVCTFQRYCIHRQANL